MTAGVAVIAGVAVRPSGRAPAGSLRVRPAGLAGPRGAGSTVWSDADFAPVGNRRGCGESLGSSQSRSSPVCGRYNRERSAPAVARAPIHQKVGPATARRQLQRTGDVRPSPCRLAAIQYSRQGDSVAGSVRPTPLEDGADVTARRRHDRDGPIASSNRSRFQRWTAVDASADRITDVPVLGADGAKTDRKGPPPCEYAAGRTWYLAIVNDTVCRQE